MTSGSPRVHIATQAAQNHAQAVEIHALTARRVPEADIAAAVGCTLARVRQVAAQPAPDTTDQPAAPEQSRSPRRDHYAHASIDTVVDACIGHPDPQIACLGDHMDGDAQIARRMLIAYNQREETARQLVASDRRRAALNAENAARHRRQSDGQAS